MALLILSFIAGVLTVAAPCILPILPVVVGGSLMEGNKDKKNEQWIRPLVVSASLAVSVVIFTLLIKATTVLLSVSAMVWQTISGIIVILLGVHYLWPHAWEWIALKTRFVFTANSSLGKASRRNNFGSSVLTGFALGPVFNSCSPTYALIVATVLPASFGQGLVYLTAYAVGLSSMLLLVAYLGQTFTTKLGWLSNPNGIFKRIIGIAFVVVGLVVMFGIDKKIQTFVLDKGWYAPISNLEQRLPN